VIADVSQAKFVLKNGSGGPLVVPRPSSPFLLVSGASGDGDVLRCETPPAPPHDLAFLTIAAGGEFAFPVDLLARCDTRPDQDFRVVVRFSVPTGIRSRPGGGASWIGTTGPVHVQVIRR
jgi:hypothetical protein